jgi:hypothetical protein
MKSEAVQSALYTALTGDVDLVAMLSSAWGVTAVFSDVPQVSDPENEVYFPYLSFGAENTVGLDDKTQSGGNTVAQINAWTRDRDYTQAKQIADRIHAVLHKGDLSISGANHIATRIQGVAFDLDPDGSTRRALMTYRVTYFNS